MDYLEKTAREAADSQIRIATLALAIKASDDPKVTADWLLRLFEAMASDLTLDSLGIELPPGTSARFRQAFRDRLIEVGLQARYQATLEPREDGDLHRSYMAPRNGE
ncbi:hypothetical protein FHS85_004928 [Rhodoligotrophos appendicifer]|uniref:hypothetical protein n=1 Tax=Rhodoligotrophos appendicifer TaxID=987056 RepID=UPI0011860A8E|nr:hypothetical protein [Rhodoligotrophos appendicifer]